MALAFVHSQQDWNTYYENTADVSFRGNIQTSVISSCIKAVFFDCRKHLVVIATDHNDPVSAHYFNQFWISQSVWVDQQKKPDAAQ